MYLKLNYILVIIVILTLNSCNKDVDISDDDNNNSVTERIITLENSYDLQVDEPSGLSFYEDGNFMTVDDNTNKIFVISPQGQLISTRNYVGDDLEGVTYNSKTKTTYVVLEAKRKLIELDTLDNILNEWSFTVNDGVKKNGFEGLTLDIENEIFYILNAASPGLRISWDYKTNKVLEEIELHFATDYSGIFYDKKDQSLWIVSDKSQKIFHTNLKGELKEDFDLDYDKAEGIIVDSDNNYIYIARDFDSNIKLFVYKLSQKK